MKYPGRAVSLLILLSLIGLAPSPVLAAEWNQWRGPNRDGVAVDSPELISSLPPEGLRPLWVSDTIPSAREGGWGSPVVSGGRVYLFVHSRKRESADRLPARKYPWLPPEKRGHLTPEQYEEYEKKRRDEDEALGKRHYAFAETVHCLDAGTGKEIWRNEEESCYTRFLHSNTLAVVGGKVYFAAAGRRARCVDARTGQSLWETRLAGEFRDEFLMSSFAVADGAVILVAGHLFGLDAASGKILWEGDPRRTRGTHSSPVVWRREGRELAIVNVASGETICLEPRTGRELWRVQSEARLSTPVIAGDRLITYGNSRKKGLRCFRIGPERGELIWTYQGLADQGSSPVVVDGHVYVQGEKRLACVDLETGTAKWTTVLDIRNPRYTSLVAANGKVFYAWDGVLCFAADPSGYAPLLAAKIDDSGLLDTEDAHRRRLGLDELEKEPDGRKKALRLYENRVGKHGPLQCASPAIAGGKFYLRLKSGIACYDLRER